MSYISYMGCSAPLTPGLCPPAAIVHISRWKEANPEGIPSLSPGLRGTSYPGCGRSKDSPTLKGFQPLTGTTAAHSKPAPCCNLFRVEHDSRTQPRVARGSQPWAGGYNPFGIEEWQVDLLVMAAPPAATSQQRGESIGARENLSVWTFNKTRCI
jgi:hypothetical protein